VRLAGTHADCPAGPPGKALGGLPSLSIAFDIKIALLGDVLYLTIL
jgi:hypothetical protein